MLRKHASWMASFQCLAKTLSTMYKDLKLELCVDTRYCARQWSKLCQTDMATKQMKKICFTLSLTSPMALSTFFLTSSSLNTETKEKNKHNHVWYFGVFAQRLHTNLILDCPGCGQKIARNPAIVVQPKCCFCTVKVIMFY